MKIIKTDIRNLLKKYEPELISVGGVATIGLTILYTKHKRRVDIYNDTASFYEAINWFDENFKDLHLADLYVKWVKENPDKVSVVDF